MQSRQRHPDRHVRERRHKRHLDEASTDVVRVEMFGERSVFSRSVLGVAIVREIDDLQKSKGC